MSKDKAGIMRYLVTLGAVVVAGLVLANMFQEYLPRLVWPITCRQTWCVA